MRLLICGDRNWPGSQWRSIFLAFADKDISVVIHGDCKGADRCGGFAAEEARIPVTVFPAQWSIYGKKAGPIRNLRMLQEGKPDEVWAFHQNLNASKGTKNMIMHALAAGVPVRHFDGERWHKVEEIIV